MDSCGNTAAAQALAVAVGGTCPVTCSDAVDRVRQAEQQNGCDSNEYNQAIEEGAAICGPDELAKQTSGLCPVDCGTAIASAEASATAEGCGSIAFSSAGKISILICFQVSGCVSYIEWFAFISLIIMILYIQSALLHGTTQLWTIRESSRLCHDNAIQNYFFFSQSPLP